MSFRKFWNHTNVEYECVCCLFNYFPKFAKTWILKLTQTFLIVFILSEKKSRYDFAVRLNHVKYCKLASNQIYDRFDMTLTYLKWFLKNIAKWYWNRFIDRFLICTWPENPRSGVVTLKDAYLVVAYYMRSISDQDRNRK